MYMTDEEGIFSGGTLDPSYTYIHKNNLTYRTNHNESRAQVTKHHSQFI